MRNLVHKGTEDLTNLDKNIDIIGGCETQYLSEYLSSLGFNVRSSYQMNVAMDPYVEMLRPDSVYRNGTATTVLISQIQTLARAYIDIEFYKNKKLKNGLKKFITDCKNQLKYIINELHKTRNVKVYILTPIEYYSPALGYFDYRSLEYWSKYEFTMQYKLACYQLARELPETYVLDSDIALELTGKAPNLAEPNIRLFENKGGHVERAGAAILAEEFIYQLLINNQKLKRIKLAVFDCDNTLYDGVIREDGINGIQVKLPKHWLRISKIITMYERGIMIALCSKNDPEDKELIFNALKKYYGKLYSGDLTKCIVTSRINWLPKSENIKDICNELNIGIDAVAFFDDNPFERSEVKTNLPSVSVFSENEIEEAPDYPIFTGYGRLTNESLSRNQKYIEDKERKAAEKSFGADRFEEFLFNCGMKLNFHPAEKTELNRVMEILQRTNQMNATLKRMSEGEINNYYQQHHILVMSLEDKFGDYGLIGTCLYKKTDSTLFIDEIALSCRAMGRKIEDALIQEIIYQARILNCNRIELEATKTSRNIQFFKVFLDAQFKEEQLTEKNYKLFLEVDGIEGRKFAPWFKVEY